MTNLTPEEKTFTKEEIIALHNIIEYAMKDISTNDEPLLNVLYEKTKVE